MTDGDAMQTGTRTTETDEVLRRIGRNVMNFQQVEYLLKYLNAHSAVRAPPSQLAEHFDKQAQAVHRNSMGELAGKLVDTVLRAPAEDDTPDDIGEVWIGFRFSFGMDAEFVHRHDSEMRALVERRNELIHHFLPRWQSVHNGDAENALAYLDAQNDETLRMMERLKGWARSLDAGRRQVAEYCASPEGQREIELAFLRSTSLVVMLGEVAARTLRPDGWMLLSTAGHLIKREAPAELEDLQKRFGVSTLKGVLMAAGLFDIDEEPTAGGGTRTIYRINERYELRVLSNPTAIESATAENA
jgi:hypothetical protein